MKTRKKSSVYLVKAPVSQTVKRQKDTTYGGAVPGKSDQLERRDVLIGHRHRPLTNHGARRGKEAGLSGAWLSAASN